MCIRDRAWAVPGDIGQGRLVVGLIRLVLAAGFAAALVAWWRWALTRALVAPAVGQGDSEKVRSSTTLERLFGMTPRGAIAARIVRSWRRDSRAKVQVASLVVIPVLMIAPTMLATGGGNEREAGLATLLGAGPLVALMAGLVVSNSLVPVSYTHLDVYKRQPRTSLRVLPPPAPSCLLYTSRCV